MRQVGLLQMFPADIHRHPPHAVLPRRWAPSAPASTTCSTLRARCTLQRCSSVSTTPRRCSPWRPLNGAHGGQPRLCTIYQDNSICPCTLQLPLSESDLSKGSSTLSTLCILPFCNSCSTLASRCCRTVFYRERAAGLYSVVPYAAAQFVIEMPYIAVQCIGYW
jgi:ABC-2 type transporter